jgi:hypothetical protein
LDIWDYFSQKEREFAAYSAYPDRPFSFEVEDGSDGKMGRIVAFLGMGEDAYMKVVERVVMRDDGSPYREAYHYALVLQEAFAYGWERDPFTHPDCPVHEHGPAPKRERKASEPVTLPEALERAWEMISLQAEAPL